MIGPAKRQAPLGIAAVIAALLAAGAAWGSPAVSSKRAEASQVLAEIQELDANLETAIEAYNAAEIRLDAIRAEQRENRRHLELARASFKRAQGTLQRRLLSLYTTGQTSVVEILLGAKSIDDLLARVDTANRVSAQDARIIRELRSYRVEIRRREVKLAKAKEEQARIVAERADRRAAIEAQLAERQQLLASIKSEIRRLQAAEARRQRRLQEQARERLEEAPATSSASAPSVGSELVSDVPPPGRYGGAVGIAMQYLGVPYRWGGASPSTGFDCSGFVMFVYAQVGVSLPHNAAAQYGYGTPVSRDQLAPGDLVFFNGLGHDGIYIGGGQFIHSPHTGDVVKISSLSESWYASTWVGARRL